MRNATLSAPTAAHDRPLRRHPDCGEPTVPSIHRRCARPRHTGCARASAYRWRAFALCGDTHELVGSPTFRLPHRNTQRHLRRRQRPAAVERALAALVLALLPTPQIVQMLAMPTSTAEATARALQSERTKRPVARTTMREPEAFARHSLVDRLWTATANDMSSPTPPNQTSRAEI